jgi:hypothetical protein
MFEKFIERTNMDKKKYQIEGVRWLLTNELRPDPVCKVRGGFVADEMGLGKTIIMIGLSVSNYLTRTLIILPPILIDQWFIQIFKTTGHKALVYHGDGKKLTTREMLEKVPIVIASYAEISVFKSKKNKQKPKIYSLIHEIKWSRVIFDEAHHLRNPKTTRFYGAKKLKARIRWLVSGTPIQNKKQDFYALCNMIRLPVSYYTDPDKLRNLAINFILKRTKKMVGIEMPEVFHENDIVEWKNKKEKDLSEEIHTAFKFSNVKSRDTHKMIGAMEKDGILAMLLRARQSCLLPRLLEGQFEKMVKRGLISNYDSYKEAIYSSSKLDSVIRNILERKNNENGKLIFCHFKEEIKEVAKRLREGGMKVGIVDGRVTGGTRTNILEAKNDALILQVQTCCEGLNLQDNYSEVFFVSPHWNPFVEEQAIARCHRIGQKKNVLVKRFIMEKFVNQDNEIETTNLDKRVNDIQESKKNIANKIIVDDDNE